MRLLKRLHRYVVKAIFGRTFSGKHDMEYIFTSDYYSSLSEKYASIEQYLHMFKNIDSHSLYHTDKRIGEHMYFASPLGVVQLKHSLGRPVFVFKNPHIDNIDLYLFKTQLGGMKAGVEGHFFKEKLFILKYVFPKINRAARQWIFNVLNDKYNLRLHEQKVSQAGIYDAQGNMLILNQFGTALHTVELTYLDRSNAFWKQAELEMIEQYEASMEEIIDRERELYNKL